MRTNTRTHTHTHRHSLYTQLVEDLSHALKAVGWPPPRAPITSPTESTDTSSQATDAAAQRRASGEGASTSGISGK